MKRIKKLEGNLEIKESEPLLSFDKNYYFDLVCGKTLLRVVRDEEGSKLDLFKNKKLKISADVSYYPYSFSIKEIKGTISEKEHSYAFTLYHKPFRSYFYLTNLKKQK